MAHANLDGRVAIVTGGAGALGRAISRYLLHAGVRISLWDSDGSALDRAGSDLNSTDVAMAVVDVTDAGQVEAAVEATLRDAGRLDILINNAAVLGDVAEIWRCDPGNWRRVIDVNLTGAFLCMRSVVPAMRRHHQGRIVNVASIQAKEGTPLSGAYAAAKAGLVAVTKTLGKELATSGITVNCVTPSAFESKMFEQIDKKRRDGILARIPMGRFCSPEEVAAMIAWICSPECSFSTGAVFDISGGRATY